MSTAAWAAVGVVALACAWIIRREYQERARQKQMVMYLRQSDLYAHLYPLIKKMEQMHVESVAIRREELRIRTYRPAGKSIRFTYDKHGFDPVEDERLLALAQAVGVDVPILRDKRRYTFVVHEDERAIGGKAAWYEYMIRTDFKDNMSRAEYLHKR